MRLRLLIMGLVVAVLAVPAVHAQAGRAPQAAGSVVIPGPNRVSMIGVRLSEVTADNVKALKLSRIEGAVVESVRPNSPAATAGLLEKDVIVQFDGERVRSAGHLARLVAETPAGREVTVSVIRGGRGAELRLRPDATESWFDPRFDVFGTWRERMDQAGRAARELLTPDRVRLGVTVQGVSGDLAEYFGVKSGVLISSVSPDSAAARAGLKAGDVITAVDGKVVDTPGDLGAALPSGDDPHDVALTVVREKKEMRVKATLTPPNRPAPGRRI